MVSPREERGLKMLYFATRAAARAYAVKNARKVVDLQNRNAKYRWGVYAL